MFQRLFNWRTVLSIIAIGIVSGTIIYSHYLADKIAADERQKVEIWVEAEKFLITSPPDTDTKLVSSIIINNNDIPIIGVNEDGHIFEHINLDSARIHDNAYLQLKLEQYKKLHEPIVYVDPLNGKKDFYYYGTSQLLREVKYYPMVQLLIVALFMIIMMYATSTRNRSVQNQLWAGMAKETAHQLGTPVTSLRGWVEMLREDEATRKIAVELGKDVDRLQLVSDRFSKIGSTPVLEEKELTEQIRNMVEYIRRRAPGRVKFIVNTQPEGAIYVKLSAPLFDWVIENLLKNALDAMEGAGTITVHVKEEAREVIIDVIDTGKGISQSNLNRVFKPGFTTKKRGWGLGLTLSKRIIEQYHNGSLFVKSSEPGKGTNFRVVLKR